jgi:hypothetical protein
MVEFVEVLKCEDNYFNLGEVVEFYTKDNLYTVPITGKMIEFNKLYANNKIVGAEISFDISDKYCSKIIKVNLDNIEEMNKIDLYDYERSIYN